MSTAELTLKKRVCKTCNLEKDLTEEFFYAHPMSKDGFMNKCKICKSTAEKIRTQGYRDLKRISLVNAQTDAEKAKALKLYGSREVIALIPDALNTLKASLKSKNHDVRFKTAVKILENGDVIGPTKIDMTVNDLRSKSVSELREIIARAEVVPAQTIELDK